MYVVNTDKIEETLTHMDRMLALLRGLLERTDEQLLADGVALAAMERSLHLAIEAVADVGNALIDGFFMRDPGSYTDIVEILRDNRVVDDPLAAELTEVVSFRRSLVTEYTRIDVAEMIRIARTRLDALARYAPSVRAYLARELF